MHSILEYGHVVRFVRVARMDWFVLPAVRFWLAYLIEQCEVMKKFKMLNSPTDSDGGMSLVYGDGYFLNSIYDSVH